MTQAEAPIALTEVSLERRTKDADCEGEKGGSQQPALVEDAQPQLEDPEVQTVAAPPLNVKELLILTSLRFFSAWGERSSAFAIYLFLVVVFPSTLVPASVFGFCTTGAGIIFSNAAGGLVDKHNRLTVVRASTAVQKLCTSVIYALFLLLQLLPSLEREGGFRGGAVAAFVAMVVCGCCLKVATVSLTLCIEREWPSAISRGSSGRLTQANTWLRRVDLVCDLVSPVFVSGLSAGVSYPFAAAFLGGMTVVSFVLEMFLSGFAYRHFVELQSDHQRGSTAATATATAGAEGQDAQAERPTVSSVLKRLSAGLGVASFVRDFMEFSKLPVFYTSLSIASIYLTVLSFDGTMLAFLKNTLDYSDPFLAGQRAACTVAGLTGTVLFPIIMHKIGLVRTGSWSIWSEFACLVPVVVALYLEPYTSPDNAHIHIPAWNAALLFGGMALSRVGLWMFDLSQLQILQESLENHPRRNRLTSMQFIMQNVFDMAKYALTMGLAKPAHFRWAGLVSAGSVFAGGVLYVFGYARRVRGHVAPHWQWLGKFKVV